jgi:hypothetical protein
MSVITVMSVKSMMHIMLRCSDVLISPDECDVRDGLNTMQSLVNFMALNDDCDVHDVLDASDTTSAPKKDSKVSIQFNHLSPSPLRIVFHTDP